jgi:hypothetical protein
MENSMKTINMNDVNAAEQLLGALDSVPGYTVRIMTPQFERVDGLKVPTPLSDTNFWSTLCDRSDEDLNALGLQKWEEYPDGTTWLFPGEWYPNIPEGFVVTGICKETYGFETGVSDNDVRFGALPYGVFKLNK